MLVLTVDYSHLLKIYVNNFIFFYKHNLRVSCKKFIIMSYLLFMFVVPSATSHVSIDCFLMPTVKSGCIITVMDKKLDSKSWHTLRQNRITTAEFQGFAYCEYHGFMNPQREIQWSKLDAIEHALFQMDFNPVLWLDMDAFFAFPQRSFVSEFGFSDCALSLDRGSQVLPLINTGIVFLRRTEQTRLFLRAMITEGFSTASINTKTYPSYHWEQNAVRWFVGKYPDLFVLVHQSPQKHENVYCHVFDFGNLQVFPKSDTDISTNPNAFIRHFAGIDYGKTFDDKIFYASRSLEHWTKRYDNTPQPLTTAKMQTAKINCLNQSFFSMVDDVLEKLSANAARIARVSVDKLFVGNGHIAEVPREIIDFASAAILPDVKTICEVGFNAGHSAAIFLLANPNARYIVFDFGEQIYSQQQIDYINNLFPNRMTYVKGNSQIEIDKYHQINPSVSCDLWSIDGDHGPNAERDFEAARKMAPRGGLVLADDCTESFPAIKVIWQRFQEQKKLKSLHCHNEDRKYSGFFKGWCLGRWLPFDRRQAHGYPKIIDQFMAMRNFTCE
jgi:hypothetical protein